MIYGYARVSTNHQDTELQRSALESAGCDHIYEEHASGRKSNRPVLKRLIAAMQAGDDWWSGSWTESGAMSCMLC